MFENEPRSLTLRESRKVYAIDDLTDRDALFLALAYGEDQEAVLEWVDSVPTAVSMAVLLKAHEASKATEAAQFPAEAASDAVDAREGQ